MEIISCDCICTVYIYMLYFICSPSSVVLINVVLNMMFHFSLIPVISILVV